MRPLVALDPGIRGCGIALFRDGMVTRAAYVANPIEKGCDVAAVTEMAAAAARWVCNGPLVVPVPVNAVIEVPRVYPLARQKGDQNDLIAIAGVAFAFASHCLGVAQYYPRDWKGTLDADDMTERIKSRLSVAELNCITKARASLMHNVYDAIGIGLKKVGRLDKPRLISRGLNAGL